MSSGAWFRQVRAAELKRNMIFNASSKCCSSPYLYRVTSPRTCVKMGVVCASLNRSASSYVTHVNGSNSAAFERKADE